MIALTFYLFSTIITALIYFVIRGYVDPTNKKKALLLPIAIIVFQLVVGIIGSKGFYINFDFPPRLVYAGILPAFVILATLSFSNAGQQLLKTIPSHFPVLFQSFRIIVELLIYWTFLKGWGPIEATMLGYNYEFYFGIFALITGVLIWKNKLNKTVVVAWNILGLIMLAIIVGIFFTTGFAWDTFWGQNERMLSNEMLEMPALSIATFYMPLAVWTHIFSIRQNLLKQD